MPSCRYILLAGLVLTASAGRGVADPQALVFEQDIQPLLTAKCGKCHTEQVQKGGLDLSTMAGLWNGGESGESAVGMTLDESPLWTMIEAGDMPPAGEPPLTNQERRQIERWLAAGAPAIATEASQTQDISQHDVLPIMLLRCTTCHGARQREGGLDLRTVAAMLHGGKSGPALVPGNVATSLIIERIENEACPPRELLLKFFVKRPPAAEIQVLRDWIEAGAPERDLSPDVATTQPDPLVTDSDRQHWAFQPLPLATTADQTQSIDGFLLAKLASKGWEFSPAADRDTLIRRAYIDLIGMPPSQVEWQSWHRDQRDDWYRAMIDHLLDSPHYGERWGRYWLDLSGYADSEGGVSADPIREVAWKYRDYVIRAFNDDKPYDRFLVEQLAGDELLDHAHAETITPEMVDNLIATGFLRMGIDQTGSRTMNFVPERLGVIGDAITVVGEGLMGLTLGCAKCHSHKYDAIPHRDYYRFKAIFQGAFDEYDWLTFKNRSLTCDTPERVQRVAQVNPDLIAQVKRLQSQLKKSRTALQLDMLAQHYPDQPAHDREETLRALQVADNNRSQPQRILVEMLQQVEVLPIEQQPASVQAALGEVTRLEQEIRRVERSMEPSLEIRALWDRGEPSPTYVLRRGEHDKPGRLVGPGVPSVLTDGRTAFVAEPPFPNGTVKTGRRLALARWLTQPQHPLTARVMVNRIWYHHFGLGLVSTLENFGVQGERPSHPELLDWLASQFVARGWSIKEMHRLIMNSRAYRQTSQVAQEVHQADPQNRLLSHMNMRRLDAEALRDSLLVVADRLDPRPGGPPDAISVDRNGLVSVIPNDEQRWRRSVYLQFRRTEIPTLLETFDYPEMGPNCLSRSSSTVSPQALHLMNNASVYSLAQALATRVELAPDGRDGTDEVRTDEVGAGWEPAIVNLYQVVLSRDPKDEELSIGKQALVQLCQDCGGDRQQALEAYSHVLLNSAAFLYVD